ncbi:PREDICTED: ras GTPase-activating protein-binding protein 2-like isoform X1 [Lupinus angustifolius]|uniref:ras GTPase-activating protein-binding protein 2-like isoform X1 n=1 Tax=Lupinus angustifolius TaxID=3871 RepID=UPI00092E863F|nr:PREDICTED: ras GTPase-activating protein-binding protein 2-like isoform X1 [Lupinus angustifolius]
MAVSDGSPIPQMVGNAFVEQYYSILHQNPDQVHKFYQESSVLSRPEEDGALTTVTTIVDINKKILSHDYTSFRVEILSADAQPSYKDGVIVLVTGCLTGSDNIKRKFTQSFFLAPQDKGYFVLNDVFRYVDEYKPVDIESVPANDAEESGPTDAVIPEPELNHVPENIPPVPSQTVVVDTETIVSNEISPPKENGKLSVAENVVPVHHVKEPSHQEHRPTTEEAASATQEDLPKKSFASIVNALKTNAAPFHVRASPVKPVEKPRVSSVHAPETPVPSTVIALDNNNEKSGKAHAIFVANLPMNATVQQLEHVFKDFGPIKPDGIQVRSNKQQGSCFGFVEFESATSLQRALEASPPVMLDNRKLSVEERRANNDRVRRGGYRNDRNDNFRGRGNFGGGRGYSGRNDSEKRGEFSGRARGGNNNSGNSNGESVPRGGYHNGGGKAPSQPVKAQ